MTDPITESDAWRRGTARAIAEAAAAAEQKDDEPIPEPAQKLAPLPAVDLTPDPAKDWTDWAAALKEMS